ncbi:MlaC/ttg2D family ABC transporter substrate-binding protein [Lyticum sinuosum]|nr:ABC transporter substrate-binding protein [Lyticum sinuosum]
MITISMFFLLYNLNINNKIHSNNIVLADVYKNNNIDKQENSYDNNITNTDKKSVVFIEKQLKKIYAIVNDNSIPKENQLKKLQDILKNSLDIEWMAKFVLGPKWNTLNSDKQKQYVKAYCNYLMNSYAPNFLKYSSQEITVVGSKPVSHGQYIVLTKVTDPNNSNSEILVSYRCKQYQDSIMIRDVIGEGISMISTQRSEFSDVIRQGGADTLIDTLSKMPAKK